MSLLTVRLAPYIIGHIFAWLLLALVGLPLPRDSTNTKAPCNSSLRGNTCSPSLPRSWEHGQEPEDAL